MTRVFLLAPLLLITLSLRAQCNDPKFSVLHEDKLCRQSPVRLVNEDPGDRSYYWDVCPETFGETPANQTTVMSEARQAYGYRLVRQGESWYGFYVSRSLDRIYRLDFGDNPANTPVVSDLGNPGGLMDAPEGIDLFKEGENWFAFVGKGENASGQVVKLSFGSDVTSTPVATGYGTFGLGNTRVRDLAVVRQGDNIILLLLLYNSASFSRINFGNSLENAPLSNSVVAIPDGYLPRGFDLVRSCDTLIGHVVCENGRVLQVSFGSDVLGEVTTSGTFTFSSVVQPWKIKTIFNKGRFVSFISCNNRKYAIIDFDNLSLTNPPLEISNGNDVRYIGFDVVKYKGKTIIQGGNGGSPLLSVSYQRNCAVQQDYSDDVNPPPFAFANEGSVQIDLSAFEDPNEMFYASHTIEVQSEEAPNVAAAFEGMCQGSEVRFAASHDQPVSSWTWKFGNGSSADSATPVAVYEEPGIYTVNVEAIGSNACLAEDNIEIKIYPPPTAGFDLPSSLLCTNNEFSFSATTPDEYDGNLSYQWILDAVEVSTERTFHHTFTTTGSKQISLSTSIPGCADEVVVTTPDVEIGPRVDFSFIGACEDEPFQFQSETTDPVVSYRWDFGNGETFPGSNAQHTFGDAGETAVSLAGTNAIGCQTIRRKTVVVYSKPLVDFDVHGPPNACAGSETVLSNTTINPDSRPIESWRWALDGSAFSIAQHGGHTFMDAGVYGVSLTAITADGCESSGEKQVVIHPSPPAEFVASAFCEDMPVLFLGKTSDEIDQFYWEIGTSYYAIPAPTHTFLVPGEYPLYLEVTGTNGCVTTRSERIHVPVPLTPAFSVTKNCVGEEAVFTDVTDGLDPVVHREWIFSDGEVRSGSPAHYSFTHDGMTNVTLAVTAQSGCVYRTVRPVDVRPAPIAEFSANPAVGAYPVDVKFANKSSGANRFFWEFLDGTGSTSSEESPHHTFLDPGEYTVRLTASNDQFCQDSFSSVITTVDPMPDVNIEMINLSVSQDGSGRLIITIHNKGNTPLKDLPVTIQMDSKPQWRENLDTVILPGEKFNFIFGPAAGLDELRYICVSVELPGDNSPAGNQLCRVFEERLVVFSAYPNPAAGMLNLEWISSEEQKVQISVVDPGGRTALTAEAMSSVGVNRSQLNVSGLPDGIYFLFIRNKTVQNIQRLLVVNSR